MDITMPQLGETATEGTITKWFKAVGDQIDKDEVLFEVSTDKVDSEVPSSASGYLTEILVPEGETVDVGVRLAVVSDERPASDDDAPAAATVVDEAPPPPPDAKPEDSSTTESVGAAKDAAGGAMSPLVRRMIAENNLVADDIPATGHGGRLTRQDVVTYLDRGVDVREVADGVDDEDNELIVHRSVHLGFAVDLNFAGLIVPVVHDADGKRLRAIAREVADLAGRARAKKLGAEDISGGTFTITNPGSSGSLITAPVINQPQVAIVSTDGIRKRPVVVALSDGSDGIAIHHVGTLAMSFDHRAFDGAYAAAFLARCRDILETRDWSLEI